MTQKKGYYLPNLNGVRAIAAIMVIVHHIEQMRRIQGMTSLWHLQGIRSMGKIAVILFFALSGFLITYLIEQEKKRTGSLNVFDFYVRRTLRIWPLYYLIVITGLFIFPHIDWLKLPNKGYHNLNAYYGQAVTMYLLFLPNFFLNYFGAIPLIAHTWSIGIEEQFYLLWPWIVKQAGKAWRNILLFIGAYSLLRLVIKFGFPAVDEWIYFPPLSALGIGGVWGLLFIKIEEEGQFQWLKNRTLQVLILLFTTGLTLAGLYFPYIFFEFYAFLFGWCLLYLASSSSLVNMENKVFLFLGKISYGLYMYHPLILYAVFAAMLHWGFQSHAFTYLVIVGGSILLAWASYEGFEARFIGMKKRFSRIVSGFDAMKK
jgi:peptidoglycan/LPS O-acetylase OafA/YrhL